MMEEIVNQVEGPPPVDTQESPNRVAYIRSVSRRYSRSSSVSDSADRSRSVSVTQSPKAPEKVADVRISFRFSSLLIHHLNHRL